MKIETNNLGLALKQARTEPRTGKKMPLRRAAALMGISNQNLSNMESGVKPFPARLLGRAADIYGVSVIFFIDAFIKDFKKSLENELNRK